MARKKGEGGFTLFTALVSFLLIVLVALLVQSMIRAERNTADTISDIDEQVEMEAIADLARADSMQVFNYGMRETMERWFTAPGVDSYVLTPSTYQDWEAIKLDFARTQFGVCPAGAADATCNSVQFSLRVAKHLTSILAPLGAFGTYQLIPQLKELELQNAVQAMINQSAATGDFFTVINCPNGEFSSCTGTFYTNMAMESLTDEQYEKLPMIQVYNTATGRTIQKPILPKGNFRIYTPLRIFKSIAGAREFANSAFSQATHDAIANVRSDWRLDKDAAKADAKAAAEAILEPKVDTIRNSSTFQAAELKIVDVRILPITASISRQSGDTTEYQGYVIESSIYITFEETLAKYKVNDSRILNYRIRVLDTGFSAPTP